VAQLRADECGERCGRRAMHAPIVTWFSNGRSSCQGPPSYARTRLPRFRSSALSGVKSCIECRFRLATSAGRDVHAHTYQELLVAILEGPTRVDEPEGGATADVLPPQVGVGADATHGRRRLHRRLVQPHHGVVRVRESSYFAIWAQT
jgi:hypothetical protein